MANSDVLLPGLLRSAGYEFSWNGGGRCRVKRGEWVGYFGSASEAVVALMTIAKHGDGVCSSTTTIPKREPPTQEPTHDKTVVRLSCDDHELLLKFIESARDIVGEITPVSEPAHTGRAPGGYQIVDWASLPISPYPTVCLYAVAMTIRGNADGSAEGTAPTAELVAMADYLQKRLDQWGDNRTDSEARFNTFLKAVLSESAGFIAGWRSLMDSA